MLGFEVALSRSVLRFALVSELVDPPSCCAFAAGAGTVSDCVQSASHVIGFERLEVSSRLVSVSCVWQRGLLQNHQ